jgi:hypothetical protein
MTEDLGDGYLSGLPEDQRDELTRVNGPGLTALREYLASGEAAALAARARSHADQAAATGDPDPVYRGRDAADAALRVATRHQLPWQELDALRAHANLDQAEGIDRGWAAKADAVHARLVPPGLDPDPLATVERLVAEQEANEDEGDD